MNKIVLFCVLLTGLPSFSYADVDNPNSKDCDPVIHLGAKVTTLQEALSRLAEQYDFKLAFPMDANRSIESVDSMTLSQSLKYLTTDLNTVLQHKKVDGCAKDRLISMEVLPVGENTEYVYVQPAAEVSQVVYIEDMALYVEEVLLQQRKKDKNLSPEQRKEFREVWKHVKARLVTEGLLRPKISKRQNNKKDRRERRRKDQDE